MSTRAALSGVAIAAIIAAGLSTAGWSQTDDAGVAPPPEAGQAADEPDRGGLSAMFDRMDADKDGKVTRDEMAAARSARADTLDADKNGTISAAELSARFMEGAQARADARAAAMMARSDANGDGELSAAELATPPMGGGRMFDRIDTDKDGAISRAEADSVADRMTERRGDRHGARGERHGGGHGKMHGRRHGGHDRMQGDADRSDAPKI